MRVIEGNAQNTHFEKYVLQRGEILGKMITEKKYNSEVRDEKNSG